MPSITSLSDVLNEIIRLKGEEILANKELVLSMISDIAPKLKTERLQLQFVINSGIWDGIIKAKSKPDNEKIRIITRSRNNLTSLGMEAAVADELLTKICDGIHFECTVPVPVVETENIPIKKTSYSPSINNQKKVITPIQGTAADYELKTISSHGELEIVKFVGFETDIMTIPGIINGKKVISIGDEAFKGCSQVKKLIVSEGINTIGTKSFADCKSLEEILLPDSLFMLKKGNESSRDGAFSRTGLRKIKLPNNLRYIPDYTFSSCSKLKEVTIGNNAEIIGKNTFSYCRSLIRINFPSFIRKINNRAFQGCGSIKEVMLNEGLLEIGDRAFQGCKSIEKIFLPKSVKSIGEDGLPHELTMYCYPGSYALQYARDHNIKYADAAKL